MFQILNLKIVQNKYLIQEKKTGTQCGIHNL